MRGTIHVAFQEGIQAQWLHDLLVPVVDRVIVCDRRGQPRQGNKGDHGDADQLSELLGALFRARAIPTPRDQGVSGPGARRGSRCCRTAGLGSGRRLEWDVLRALRTRAKAARWRRRGVIRDDGAGSSLEQSVRPASSPAEALV